MERKRGKMSHLKYSDADLKKIFEMFDHDKSGDLFFCGKSFSLFFSSLVLNLLCFLKFNRGKLMATELGAVFQVMNINVSKERINISFVFF